MNGPKVLVAYHSVDGQTEQIASHIAERLRTGGATVTLANVAEAGEPTDVEVVVAGGPIHVGRHSSQLTGYLTEHAAALASRRLALFQVCLTSANPSPEDDATTQGYVTTLLEETGVQPDIVARFAGALAYTRYGRMKRALMKRIATSNGQSTDTSHDHVFTDWDEVDRFADDVLDASAAPTA